MITKFNLNFIIHILGLPIIFINQTMNQVKTLTIFTLLLTSIACVTSSSSLVRLSSQYNVGDIYMQIRLQGTLELANTEFDGLRLTDLSGLAWDEDDKLLYAVADEGYLFHLQPIISDNILTKVNVLAAYRLQNYQGKPLQIKDAEGLAILNGNNGIVGDGELVISFERIPKIARFTPQAKLLSEYPLPANLQNIASYYSSNKIFETVTVHPQFGILTIPEWPLKSKNVAYSLKKPYKHTLYAIDSSQKWTFPAYPIPNSAAVGLETLTDGSLLVLERAFVSPAQPLIVSLRQVWLTNCAIGDDCEVKQIAVFDNNWQIGNFEGLTYHKDNHFFMVSDDDDSNLQQTLLSYFEVMR